jgi:hypothetical protein
VTAHALARGRRLKLAGLLLLLAVVVSSHFSVETRDGAPLLVANGRPLDAAGWWADARTRWQRRWQGTCDGVEPVATDHATSRAALGAVRAYSEPDSRSAQLHSARRAGAWWLVEARFDRLEPAAVLLQEADGRLQVVDTAIWSGPTEPWRPGPLMRRYLAERAPAVPVALLNCFDPDPALFSHRLP